MRRLIHDPVRNKKCIWFLPQESWLDGFKSGFVDSFRHFNSDPHNIRGGVTVLELGNNKDGVLITI
jgi:hypothetical protein